MEEQLAGQKRLRDDDNEGLPVPAALSPAKPAQKKIKLDEDSVDFLICDLSREESHLVLTRLLRVVGEDAMRTQVELVRHARQKVTAAEVERQLKQLQQLQQLQASCSPLMGTPFAVGERGADEATPRGAGKTPSKARLRGIKNRVRDAFKRQLDGGRPVHSIRLDALEEDLQRVRDDGLRGQLSLALGAMEAITEELVDRASQVDQVTNFEDALEQLGTTWLEVFLGEAYNVTAEEREDWAEKLRSWDTSAGAESPLLCARLAAATGWQEQSLQAVLSGDQEAAAAYKEPQKLALARLAALEREKRLEEACALARAANLDQHAAKFLMKLGRVEEAVEATLRLTDADKVFATAQVARPVDAKAAFRLALASIAKASDMQQVSSLLLEPKLRWLCELSAAEGLGEELVSSAPGKLLNKGALQALCDALFARNSITEAARLGSSLLENFSKETLLEANGLWSAPGAEEGSTLSVHRLRLLVPGVSVPNGAAAWLWRKLSSAGAAADVASDEVTQKAVADAQEQLVRDAARATERVDDILDLMRAASNDCRYLVVNSLGAAAISLVNKQEGELRTFDEETVRLRLLHEEQATAARLRGEPVAPFAAPLLELPKYAFEDKRMAVCTVMVHSALAHKAMFQEAAKEPSTATSAATSADGDVTMGEASDAQQETDAEREARLEKLQKCSKVLEDVTALAVAKVSAPHHLLRLAREMKGRSEFRLALRVATTSFSAALRLEEARPAREETLRAHQEAKAVVEARLAQQLQPEPESVQELKRCAYQAEVLKLDAPFLRQSCSALRSLIQSVAEEITSAALAGLVAIVVEERLSADEATKAVMDTCAAMADPKSIMAVAQLCSSKKGLRLSQAAAKQAASALSRLQQAFESRRTLEVERDLLAAEQTRTRERFARDLDSDALARLTELETAIDALPAPSPYTPSSTDAFEQMFAEISQLHYSAAVERCSTLEKMREKLARALVPDAAAIAVFDENIKEAEEKLPVAFEECLTRHQAPFFLHRFLEQVARSQEVAFTLTTLRRLVDLLDSLHDSMFEWSPKAYELRILAREESRLWTEHQHSKTLSSEQILRLRELRLAEKLRNSSGSWMTLDGPQLASIAKNSLLVAVKLVQARQDSACSRLSVLSREARDAEAGVQADGVVIDAAAAAARREAEAKDLLAELPTLREQMACLVSDCLVSRRSSKGTPRKQLGPGTLLAVVSAIRPPSHHTFSFVDGDANLEHAVTLCTRVFGLVAELRKTRESRVDTYEQRDLLVSRRSTLAVQHKTLSPEEEEKLAGLERQVWLWGQEPMSSQLFSADRVDKLASRAALAQLTAVLNRQKHLRATIASLKEEHSQASSRAASASAAAKVEPNGTNALACPIAEAYFTEAAARAEENLTAAAALLKRVIAALLADSGPVVNPEHLTDIGNVVFRHVADDRDGLPPITAQISAKSFAAIEKLQALAQERDPILEELDELEAEETRRQQLGKAAKGDTSSRLQELRHLAYHWKTEATYRQASADQRDAWYLAAASLPLSAGLAVVSAAESELNAAREAAAAEGTSLAGTALDEAEALEAEAAAARNILQEQLPGILEKIKSPTDLLSLQEILAREWRMVRSVGEDCETKASALDAHRQHLCDMEKEMHLLRVEAWQLQQVRQPHPADRAARLVKLEKAFEEEPDLAYGITEGYCSYEPGPDGKPVDDSKAYNNSQLGTAIHSAVLKSFSVVFANHKALGNQALNLRARAVAEHLPNLETEAEALEAEQERVAEAAREMAAASLEQHAPPLLQKLLQLCQREGPAWHQQALAYCSRLAELAGQMREEEQARQDGPVLERQELQKKKKELIARRLDLDAEDAGRLADLLLAEGLRTVLPRDQRSTVRALNDAQHKAVAAYLSEVDAEHRRRRAELEAQGSGGLSRAVSLTEEEYSRRVADEEERHQKELTSGASLATSQLHQALHLVSVFNSLVARKETAAMVTVGRVAQRRLAEALGALMRHEACARRLQQLREHPQSDPAEVEELAAMVEELRRTVASQEGLDTPHRARSSIESIAGELIDAAMLDKGSASAKEVVREQAILVFKMRLSPEKLEEVKNLVSVDEWPPLRKELLDIVVNYDPSLPGAVIDVKAQLDLLLREGMYEEALRVCPEPPGRDQHNTDHAYEAACDSYGELLQMLWFEVEKVAPEELAKVYSLVQTFARLQYQREKFGDLETLLDGVQAYFPEKVPEIFETGSEILVANMSAKTYATYVEFLIAVKRRLLDMAMHDEWTAFITQARMEQKRKKKLIQLMNVANLK